MKKWITLENSKCYEETQAFSEGAEAAKQVFKMTDAPNEGRNLENTLDGILLQTAGEIQAGGKWKAAPEVRTAELDIDRTLAEVMTGVKTVEDFRAACKHWKEAGTC